MLETELIPAREKNSRRLMVVLHGLGDSLEGYRLAGRAYQLIRPDDYGHVWSEKLGAALGLWHGEVLGTVDSWFRFFHADGSPVPTAAEAAAEKERRRTEMERHRANGERHRADEERQRADEATRRAEAAEAELARLRAQMQKP